MLEQTDRQVRVIIDLKEECPDEWSCLLRVLQAIKALFSPKKGGDVEITLTMGESKKLASGAVVTRIQDPDFNPGRHRAVDNNMADWVRYILGAAKSRLVHLNCEHYQKCIDDVSCLDGNDPDFREPWWAFSCQNCPFNKI